MTLAPPLEAPVRIQVHAFAAMAAFVIGAVQLAAPKGTVPHRLVGWTWVVVMLTVAISSIFIDTIRMWGPWSPIHLLSLLVLVILSRGVWEARRQQTRRHGRTMTMLFAGALVIAGGFTLMPGRIMHAVVFGP